MRGKEEVKLYRDKKVSWWLKCVKQHKYKRKWRNTLSTEAQTVVAFRIYNLTDYQTSIVTKQNSF